MLIENGKIRIRTATTDDVNQLVTWWNDGAVMAHAGFPRGLGTTTEEVAAKLADKGENSWVRLILEWEGAPIGELCYGNAEDGAAEIGIKICNADYQERGLGRVVLSMLIRQLFEMGYSKIVLDTNLKNLRAQHVYEKLGFQRTAVHMDSWRNQLGELESAVDYALTKDNFMDFS